jgi:Domain of unknown function (DUF4431)
MQTVKLSIFSVSKTERTYMIGSRQGQFTFHSILILISLLAVQSAYATDTFQLEPAVVTLTGKLIKKEFYGPPGYGEDPKTDSKEQAAILHLTSPINVVAEKDNRFNETRDNAREVQLINVKGIDLSKFFQNNVKVSGKLSSAITGHHHTDILIEIDDIRLQN